MAEYKFFTGDQADVSTADFHKERARADHWSEGHQRPRMERALEFIKDAAIKYVDLAGSGCLPITVSDLGCGDGGLLENITWLGNKQKWGYDFQPANVEAAWKERGLNVMLRDVFNAPPFFGNALYSHVRLGNIVVMTEVLEHLTDPHHVLDVVANSDATEYVVASSPWGEHMGSHDACHAWGWDYDGYERLFANNGWRILKHDLVDWSQVVLAEVRR